MKFIKVLFVSIYVWGSLYAWGQQKDSEQTFGAFLPNKFDSINISCGFFRNNKHNFMFFDIVVSVNHAMIVDKDHSHVGIDCSDYRDQLIFYISQFYIYKTEKIYLLRKKRKIIYAMEYPSIILYGYKNGRRKQVKWVTIGEFSYDIKFNPKFEDFYLFLEFLANKYLSSKSDIN